MARPTKQGIEYFPIDSDFDPKIEMYLLEKEALGLASLIVVWQLIYGDEGYFCRNGEDLSLLIKKRVSADINSINECINAMLRRQIFSQELHKKYGILTSRGVQKRFFEAAKRKKEVRVVDEFLLISVNDYINIVNVDINEVIECNNATKVKEEVKEEVNINTRKRKLSKKSLLDPVNELWFQEFYASYPRHEAKEEARKAWSKIAMTKELFSVIMDGVDRYKKTEQVQGGDGKFIKLPGSWLNGRRWEDEFIGSSRINGISYVCLNRIPRNGHLVDCGKPAAHQVGKRPLCEECYAEYQERRLREV